MPPNENSCLIINSIAKYAPCENPSKNILELGNPFCLDLKWHDVIDQDLIFHPSFSFPSNQEYSLSLTTWAPV